VPYMKSNGIEKIAILEKAWPYVTDETLRFGCRHDANIC
jgi:hypothetical protein